MDKIEINMGANSIASRNNNNNNNNNKKNNNNNNKLPNKEINS
jgi:hypothetical protein